MLEKQKHRNGKPAYQRIHSVIRKRIESRQLRVGTRPRQDSSG
jgi:DNA-binding GntR family transcriptional regulator